MTNKQRAFFVALGIIILTLIAFPRTAHEAAIEGEIGTATSTDARAGIIDEYFAQKGMPLEGYGDLFVAAADEYGNDWRILPAISVIESTGGKFACGNNPFGWGSCRSGVGAFESIPEAIDYVSWSLGGHNPRLRSAYAGGTDEDLMSFNGTVDPTYPGRVKAVMDEISLTPLPYR